MQAKGQFKLVILGEQSVGKTALMTRYCYGTWDPSYQGIIV
jgi:GTPase SAR1 family protein